MAIDCFLSSQIKKPNSTVHKHQTIIQLICDATMRTPRRQPRHTAKKNIVSMHACMYVCSCIYVSMHACMDRHAQMHAWMYVHTYIHTYLCMCLCVCVYMSMCLCLYVCVSVSICLCVCVFVCLCLCVCMHVRIYNCARVLCTYICALNPSLYITNKWSHDLLTDAQPQLQDRVQHKGYQKGLSTKSHRSLPTLSHNGLIIELYTSTYHAFVR